MRYAVVSGSRDRVLRDVRLHAWCQPGVCKVAVANRLCTNHDWHRGMVGDPTQVDALGPPPVIACGLATTPATTAPRVSTHWKTRRESIFGKTAALCNNSPHVAKTNRLLCVPGCAGND